MVATLVRNWWVPVVRGVAAIVFGILAFVWPDITVLALVILFGAYALVDGVFAIVAAFRAAERHRRWWPLVLEGISGIAVGAITFFWPDVTAFALLYLIAVWAFITGVWEIAAAIRLRRDITNEWFLVLMGILSIGFAVLVVIFPGEGALGLVWAIGAYAIAFGVLLIGLGLRLRKRRTLPRAS